MPYAAANSYCFSLGFWPLRRNQLYPSPVRFLFLVMVHCAACIIFVHLHGDMSMIAPASNILPSCSTLINARVLGITLEYVLPGH